MTTETKPYSKAAFEAAGAVCLDEHGNLKLVSRQAVAKALTTFAAEALVKALPAVTAEDAKLASSLRTYLLFMQPVHGQADETNYCGQWLAEFRERVWSEATLAAQAQTSETLEQCRTFFAGCEQVRDGLVDGTTVTAEWVRDFFADLPDLPAAPSTTQTEA